MKALLIVLAAVAIAAIVYAPLASQNKNVEMYSGGPVYPGGLPFSDGARVGDLIILSGHLGNVPGELVLVEGGFEAEARQTMDNIKATLEANGYSMKDIVKCTVMLEDIGDWPKFNAIYETYFEAPYPARSAYGTDGLALGALVEVECMAAVRK